jgi:quinoprotein glucose dehydrogenase
MRRTHLFTVLMAAGVANFGAVGEVAVRSPLQAQELASQWGGVYTSAQAQRGEPLYAENCAACHNWDLTGNEIGPALAGDAFSARWDGRLLAELFDYTRALMPQNSPGGLSRQQTADVLAFMLSTDGAPAGQTEFPSLTEDLGEALYERDAP